MTEKSFIAGFGGQGIISFGQLWVYCAMEEGLNVTFFPFYGAEKRGGIARAGVIASDREIASPLVTTADSVVVMNEESLPLCEGLLRKGGTMLVNSSLVKAKPARNDMRIFNVPANALAEKCGDLKIANMVMMGALATATGAIKLDAIEPILRKFFPVSKHKYLAMNMEAIKAGHDAVEP